VISSPSATSSRNTWRRETVKKDNFWGEQISTGASHHDPLNPAQLNRKTKLVSAKNLN
jgi:hypothetical protein